MSDAKRQRIRRSLVRHWPRRAIGGAPDTPLALDLPPGEYTVRVRNPAFADTLALTATVKPGAVERRVVEFRRVDAADYFRKTGT